MNFTIVYTRSSRGWYSSNSNLTSSDSTPSSDQNIDSGADTNNTFCSNDFTFVEWYQILFGYEITRSPYVNEIVLANCI